MTDPDLGLVPAIYNIAFTEGQPTGRDTTFSTRAHWPEGWIEIFAFHGGDDVIRSWAGPLIEEDDNEWVLSLYGQAKAFSKDRWVKR